MADKLTTVPKDYELEQRMSALQANQKHLFENDEILNKQQESSRETLGKALNMQSELLDLMNKGDNIVASDLTALKTEVHSLRSRIDTLEEKQRQLASINKLHYAMLCIAFGTLGFLVSNLLF